MHPRWGAMAFGLVTALAAWGCTPGGSEGGGGDEDGGSDGGLDGAVVVDMDPPDMAPTGPAGSWVEMRLAARTFTDLAWFDGRLYAAGDQSVVYTDADDAFAQILPGERLHAFTVAAGPTGAYLSGPARFYFPFMGRTFAYEWAGFEPFTGGLSLGGGRLFGGAVDGLVQWAFAEDGTGQAPVVAAGDVRAVAGLETERALYATPAGLFEWNPVDPADPQVESAADETITGLHAPAADFAVAVGAGGVVHTGVGGAWQTAYVDGRPALADVWSRAPDDIWAVGAGGIVVHYDGAEWRVVESPTTADLTAVVGDDAGVWIAAADGVLYWFGPEGQAPSPVGGPDPEPEPEPDPEPEPPMTGHLRMLAAALSVRVCDGPNALTGELSTGDVRGYDAVPAGRYELHTNIGPRDQCASNLGDSEVRFDVAAGQGVTVIARSFSFGGTDWIRDDPTPPMQAGDTRLRIYSWFEDGPFDACIGGEPVATALNRRSESAWVERPAGDVELALHTPADPPCSGALLAQAPIELGAGGVQTVFIVDPTNRDVEEVSIINCVDSVDGAFGRSRCTTVRRDL